MAPSSLKRICSRPLREGEVKLHAGRGANLHFYLLMNLQVRVSVEPLNPPANAIGGRDKGMFSIWLHWVTNPIDEIETEHRSNMGNSGGCEVEGIR
jgi:hypothetical protein